ncbi:hypothetical protein [Chromohalobacter moromii]|uniref:Uncharacterized protein n=1 Tax=Chromohalobacter moromii TaxID=2860329 RepID=A0A9X2X3R9_9GAMM|nr:hypothetical protein [Chromohalobacter moromii]MCT8506176.1 hypothetical protein [Chromohalobacter moromii]
MTQEKSFDELEREIGETADKFMDFLNENDLDTHAFNLYQTNVRMALKKLEKRISKLEKSS